jgi:hypothetical protein
MSFIFIVNERTPIIEADTLLELASYLPISVENGFVTFDGIRDTISYNTKDFTTDEIIIDFCRDRLPVLANRKGMKIYKANRLF